MATVSTQSIRARREAVVNAHIEAEAVIHDVGAAIATFHRHRYEVPSVGVIAEGAEAVIVEAKFGGTHLGPWAGIAPTGTPWRSRAR
jgi:hypothetical protein